MSSGQPFVSDDQKTALALLADLDDAAKLEFIAQGANFLTSGINRRLFSVVAKKLGKDVADVEACIFAIMKLFTDSARLELKAEDIERSLSDQLGDVWAQSGCVAKFSEVYTPALPAIRQMLKAKSERVSLLEYHDVDWRLEAEVANRFARDLQPPRVKVSVQLELNGPLENIVDNQALPVTDAEAGGIGRYILESDVPTLAHVTKSLEQALQHGKDRHSRRLAKNL